MYFTNCKTLEELKRTYKKLAFANHPDRGGDPEIMKAINAEYDKAFQRLKNRHESAEDPTKTYEAETAETPEEFREIIETLLHLDGVEIEMCGRWLWLSGNTYAHREALKKAACKWANKKKLWYWHPAEDGERKTRHTLKMEEIREKYGSEKVGTGKGLYQLT